VIDRERGIEREGRRGTVRERDRESKPTLDIFEEGERGKGKKR
jgi:hypothetical protein